MITYKKLQNLILFLYRIINSTKIFQTRWGREIFDRSYLAYKYHLEAGPISQLEKFIKPESYIIDVGANIGFFTLFFAKWVSGKGKVIALEPEKTNFSRLIKTVKKISLPESVESLNFAVSDIQGQAKLEINPHHPADHKLGKNGVNVNVTTIDDLLAERNWPEVSLIKIDVQGAEMRVLNGAKKTLQKFRPALFVELHNESLEKYGSSAKQLLSSLIALNYSLHILDNSSISTCLTIEDILAIEDNKGYIDVLLLPD